MKFFVDINDSNFIVVHEADCKMINEFRKSHIPDFYESYDEALEYANQKKIIYEFKLEDCTCCNPKEKSKMKVC